MSGSPRVRVFQSSPPPLMVPCPTCHGQGQVDATRCIATRADGRPCQQLARTITHPGYLEEFASGDPARYPPRFMDYCGRHGNTLRRRQRDGERRAQIRAKMTSNGQS